MKFAAGEYSDRLLGIPVFILVRRQNLKDDKTSSEPTFPRAILLSAVIAFFLLTLASLSVAVVVPAKDLNIVTGIMETFTIFLDAHGLKWLIPVMALLVAIGAVGEISAWIIGPAKGLMTTAADGKLPPFLQNVNRVNAPVNILIVQGFIASAFTTVFLFIPTVSGSYWLLIAFTALIYLLMYRILFAATIRLRYTRPNVPREYRIPGGWLLCGLWPDRVFLKLCSQ